MPPRPGALVYAFLEETSYGSSPDVRAPRRGWGGDGSVRSLAVGILVRAAPPGIPVAAIALAPETAANLQVQDRGQRWISPQDTAQRDNPGLLVGYVGPRTCKHLPLVLSQPHCLRDPGAAERIEICHDSGIPRNRKRPFVVKPAPDRLDCRAPRPCHVRRIDRPVTLVGHDLVGANVAGSIVVHGAKQQALCPGPMCLAERERPESL